VGYEKGPSLAGARVEDANFSGARLHAPDFEGAKITDASFYGADISGEIGGLRVNGVEVAPLIEAELDRRFPDRTKLRATDPDGLAEAWALIEGMWQATVARARALPTPLLRERVDDEWSFVETLRHLVLATDIWLRRMVKGQARPYHPWGLAGSWLTDPASWGIDAAADPSLDEILAVRRERMDEVQAAIAAVTPEELDRVCTPPETPGHPNRSYPVLGCLHVILKEEWEHHQYAVRDLESLESPPVKSGERTHR
jgi:DinB superfamily/Pentapeptide repeats (8 copies)